MEAKLMQPGGRRYPKAGKKLIPPKLNLNQKSSARRRGSSSHHDEFDCRPFSFIENDPITPGFDPITPFEITPPQSPENHGQRADGLDLDDDDDVIIDSPAPTPGFFNKMRDAIPEEDEDEVLRKNNENEFISKQLGFSHGDFHKRSSFRDMSNLRKKAFSKRMSRNNKRDTTMTVFSDDGNRDSVAFEEEPFTPFADVAEFDHDEVQKPKVLIPGFAPVQITKFVATELVCPVPTHPTPLSPTMERFLSRMQEVVQTPASARFPPSAMLMPPMQAPPSPEHAAMTSHVIDVNVYSAVAMEFEAQGMTDISHNQALVLQESDPLMDQSADTIAAMYTYMMPIILNNAPRHCSCTAELSPEEREMGYEPAMHPNNIMRLENVIVQVRLAPRPRVKRHGWTFLNIGIPTRVALSIMQCLEGVSIGKCKMVQHGDYFWIYTPMRAFTKIYRRSPRSSTNQRRASDIVPEGYYNEDDEDYFEESEDEEEDLYQELSDSQFYSLLDGRSLEVDLYAEVYAKSQTGHALKRPSEGDFSLGVSIREVIVTSDAQTRGPEWATSKSQRSKCNARGHNPPEALFSPPATSPQAASPLSAMSNSSTNVREPERADMDHTPKPRDYRKNDRAEIPEATGKDKSRMKKLAKKFF